MNSFSVLVLASRLVVGPYGTTKTNSIPSVALMSGASGAWLVAPSAIPPLMRTKKGAKLYFVRIHGGTVLSTKKTTAASCSPPRRHRAHRHGGIALGTGACN